MGSKPRQILGIGILKESSEDDPKYDAERVKQEVNEEVQKLRNAGFEITVYFFDKNSQSDLSEVRTLLRSQQWAGVSIGFGIRGAKEFTPLFENVVNSVLEETNPVPLFMFTSHTTDIYNAAKRVFLL